MRHRGAEADGGGAPSWADGEIAGCDLGDRRSRRATADPAPAARRGGGPTAAARLPGLGRDQGRVPLLREPAVRRGRRPGRALRGGRCAVRGAAPLLVVQDTTELVDKWAKPGGQVGLLKRAPIWRRGP